MKMGLVIGLALTASACTLDDSAVDDEETGSAEQGISGWAVGAIGTTTTTTGFDTGWSTSNSTCVLTAVLGNLREGGWWSVGDVASEASVKRMANGHWGIFGHGGAYEHTAANNPVMAGAVCVPFPPTSSGHWRSQDTGSGPPALPSRFADLAPTRRCFLTAVFSDWGNFGQFADSVQAVRIEAGETDGTHPTTGWYVQGTLTSNPYNGAPAGATATCVDFPAIAGEWGGAFGGATNTMTTGSGTKMCGLTGIFGAFNVNSFSNGVALNAPSAQNGNWTMTVASSKFATANCIQ